MHAPVSRPDGIFLRIQPANVAFGSSSDLLGHTYFVFFQI
jgi:hypothetical protein